jgi:endonuclease-3
MKNSINNFDYVFTILKENYDKGSAPSVTLISSIEKTPYHVLVSTLISLRTKDEVTLQSSRRLFQEASSFTALLQIEESRIAELIYPAGFYKTKAARLREIARIVTDEWSGSLPDDVESLLALPGVGRKTANLVVSLGFNKPGLCVDTHVHRITNRFGWVKTTNPEKTEFALRKLLPEKYWRPVNDYLVSYGQVICRPTSPHCSICRLNDTCPKIGVIRSR